MKKHIRILIYIILLIPCIVYAENDYYQYEYFNEIFYHQFAYSDVKYGTEIEYRNGYYYISNIVNGCYYNSDECKDIPILYTCNNSNTECKEANIIFHNTKPIHTDTQNGGTAVKLKNGLNNNLSNGLLYLGNDFIEEEGKYRILNYETRNFSDITAETLSRDYVGYYLCLDNWGITCNNLVRIAPLSNNSIGTYYIAHYIPADNYFLVSDKYQKINNSYVLINPKKTYPADDGGITGYTCKSKEDQCTNLYSINISDYYDIHDGGRLSIFSELEVDNQSIEKNIQLQEKIELSTYYNEEEINKVFSTNPEVADIKENIIETYKAGKTDIIYEDDFKYKVLHLTINSIEIQDNPKTNNSYSLIIIVIIMLSYIITLAINKKEKNSKLI